MRPNTKKIGFLASIPIISIHDISNDLAKRAKFNFSYFCEQPQAGQNFNGWTNEELVGLCEKLVNFSREPLGYWEKTRAGMGKGHVFEVYDSFPRKSNFDEPPHVPHQALWARFRIDRATRLVGFVLPSEFDRKEQGCGYLFDCNTFYIVFLDKNHDFYLMD